MFARIFKPLDKFKRVNKRKQRPMSIFMLGLDSVSRRDWLTNLPRSTSFLFDTIGAKQLTRFNVVGDGTVAALTALLTGKYEHELPSAERSVFGSRYVDEVYPFLWKNLSSGYASFYGEDWPAIGTFQYRLNGMRRPATDHYMRFIFKNNIITFTKLLPTFAFLTSVFIQLRYIFTSNYVD
jgi:hypothetical protein